MHVQLLIYEAIQDPLARCGGGGPPEIQVASEDPWSCPSWAVLSDVSRLTKHQFTKLWVFLLYKLGDEHRQGGEEIPVRFRSEAVGFFPTQFQCSDEWGQWTQILAGAPGVRVGTGGLVPEPQGTFGSQTSPVWAPRPQEQANTLYLSTGRSMLRKALMNRILETLARFSARIICKRFVGSGLEFRRGAPHASPSSSAGSCRSPGH